MPFTPLQNQTTPAKPATTASAPGGFKPLQEDTATAPKASKPQGWYGKLSDTFGDVGVGVVKGVGSLAKGLGTMGGAILRAEERLIDKAMGVEPGSIPSNVAPIYIPGTEQSRKADEWLKGDNAAEKIGKTAFDIGSFFIPGENIAAFESALASKVPGAMAKYAPMLPEFATKVATKATQLGIKSAVEGLSNYGIAYLMSGGDKETAKGAGIAGAAIPGVGFGLKALREPASKLVGKAGEGMINSLVKPLMKDFSYGKDPARGILREGIVANGLDDLAEKIGIARNDIGNEIGTINEIVQGKVTFDAGRALSPIDQAIQRAAKNNDTSVFNRLNEIKTALTQNLSAKGGQIVSSGAKDLSNVSAEEMFNIKRMIGDMTKFTGNASDDKAVNSALKETYGKLKQMYNSGVTKVDPRLGKQIVDLNERYADLTSAEVATKYREILDKRANIVSLAGHLGMGASVISAIATGNWGLLGAGLLSELTAKAAGSTGVKTRVAKFLAGLAESDRALLMNQSPTLRRIFGEFDPLETNVKDAIPDNVPGVYKTGERYPMLNAPAPGSPQSSINTPINLPARSPSTAEAVERANMRINKEPDRRGGPLALPAPGQTSARIEMPSAGTFDRNRARAMGTDETKNARIRNTNDRRKLINKGPGKTKRK